MVGTWISFLWFAASGGGKVNFDKLLTAVLSIAGLVGSLVAITGYLSKKLVEQLLQKELEDHRAKSAIERDKMLHALEKEKIIFQKDLERHVAEQQERLRTDLEIAASERRHRTELLHSKRFDVLCELYQRWQTLLRAVNELVKFFKYVGEPSDEDKFQHFGKAYQAFVEYYKNYEILFDDDVTEIVDQVIDTIATGMADYAAFREWWGTKDRELQLQDSHARHSASKFMHEQVPKVRERLKASVKRVLAADLALSTALTPFTSDKKPGE